VGKKRKRRGWRRGRGEKKPHVDLNPVFATD
jgi:hypothetical protein